MADNFQDNVGFGASTLSVSGDAIAVGTAAGSKSIIFSNNNGAGHLVWGPSANRTISLPDNGGVVLLSSQGILSISGGTTRATSGEVVFSNSNGISFGVNGNTVTATYTVPSTAGLISAVNLSAGTTSNNLSAFVFSNSNNVSFGLSGSTVTATITVPAQTNQTAGLYAVGNTTGQSSSSTFDARTISFRGTGGVSVGYSNGSVLISGGAAGGGSINLSAGTTSNNLTNFVLSNSNNVSFGLNGSTVTATASFNQTNQTVGLYALGNTTQNSSSTLDARTLSFNALGAMTMGYSNGSIQVSAPVTSSLSATGMVSISVNGSTISIGVPTLVGVNGISISTNATSASVIGPAASFFEPFVMRSDSTSFAPSIGSWYLQPFLIPAAFLSGRANILVSFSNSSAGVLQASSSVSFVSNTTGSRAITYNYSKSMALYVQGTGTNSSRLETYWSNTWTAGIRQTVSVSTAGATTIRATNAATLSYIASVGTDGAYTTTSLSASHSTSSAGNSIATTLVSSNLSSLFNILTGAFVLPVGLNTSMSPGNYWLAQAWSTASTTSGTSANAWPFVNQQVISVPAQSNRLFGATASSSGSQYIPGYGVFSVATASPPATIAFTDIRSYANVSQYFNFIGSNA